MSFKDQEGGEKEARKGTERHHCEKGEASKIPEPEMEKHISIMFHYHTFCSLFSFN